MAEVPTLLRNVEVLDRHLADCRYMPSAASIDKHLCVLHRSGVWRGHLCVLAVMNRLALTHSKKKKYNLNLNLNLNLQHPQRHPPKLSLYST